MLRKTVLAKAIPNIPFIPNFNKHFWNLWVENDNSFIVLNTNSLLRGKSEKSDRNKALSPQSVAI